MNINVSLVSCCLTFKIIAFFPPNHTGGYVQNYISTKEMKPFKKLKLPGLGRKPYLYFSILNIGEGRIDSLW